MKICLCMLLLTLLITCSEASVLFTQITLYLQGILNSQQKYKQLANELQSMGSASLYYIQKYANNQLNLTQTFQNKESSYFNTVAEEVMDNFINVQASYLQLKQIKQKLQQDQMCSDYLGIWDRALEMLHTYQQILYRIYVQYGIDTPNLIIHKVDQEISQCVLMVTSKKRNIKEIQKNIKPHKNKFMHGKLMNKITEYMDCFNYDAAQSLVEAAHYYLDNFELYKKQLQFVEVLRRHRCPIHEKMKDELQFKKKHVQYIESVSRQLLKWTEYKNFHKLRLPVQSITKIMIASNRYEKYITKNKQQHAIILQQLIRIQKEMFFCSATAYNPRNDPDFKEYTNMRMIISEIIDLVAQIMGRRFKLYNADIIVI